MDHRTINAIRLLIEGAERKSVAMADLYRHEEEFMQYPWGISVIVPINNGVSEMGGLLHSLTTQNIYRHNYEVIFSLNGCTDNTSDTIRAFCLSGNILCTVIESNLPSISIARNRALELAKFRFATFVDHDDTLSRAYLQELISLCDYRSIVVSNIMRVENGALGPDYAQEVISVGFEISKIHPPSDIDLCFRAYTLNAIKVAPTYMLKRISYDVNLDHCEDIMYWRNVFHAFTPITVKSPGWRDIYYRTVRPRSASRGHLDLEEWARPRLSILRQLESESSQYAPKSPQYKFDLNLAKLLRETLSYRGLICPPPSHDRDA